jgi:hypothetical protein
MDTQPPDNSAREGTFGTWSKTVNYKTKKAGTREVSGPDNTKAKKSSPVRVYSASGAVQVGTRVVTSEAPRKPAWQRDDIDYDCYLTD